MKYVLFLFSISLVFNACKDDCGDDGKCTSEELSWNPYYDGQMLIFENDSLVRDTVFVRVNEINVELPKMDDYCTKSQVFQSHFEVGNDSLTINVSHAISYSKVDFRPCLYSISRREYFEEHPDSISLMINNVFYPNVRLLMNRFSYSSISNIYYSKTKGVLSYQLSDSTIWRVVN
jgi:hypothetical protein